MRAGWGLVRRSGRLRRPGVRLHAASGGTWLVCLVVLATGGTSRAEQLPFRHYGAAEGLGGSLVRAIYQDRHGYLWFGSNDGLARFDGYRFTNYGVHDGLVVPAINVIAEDRQGRLWVGTNGAGVARLVEEPPDSAFEPGSKAAPRTRFVVHQVAEAEASNRVNAMAFDADGKLWCVVSREIGIESP